MAPCRGRRYHRIMFFQSTKFRLIVVAMAALNALLFGLRQDWISVGIAVLVGAVFTFYIVRDKRKSDAKGS
jgi:hypothetical protein